MKKPNDIAIKRVIAYQLEQDMKAKTKISRGKF